MDNKDMPAMACKFSYEKHIPEHTETKDGWVKKVPAETKTIDVEAQGLTKREYAAIHIMAAMQVGPANIEVRKSMAHFAVAMTDALFDELDKHNDLT